VVGKLTISAFKRVHSRWVCILTWCTPTETIWLSTFHVVNAYTDDLVSGGVQQAEIRIRLFIIMQGRFENPKARCFPRLRRRLPRRDTAPCQRTPNYAYRVAVRSSSNTLRTVLLLDSRWRHPRCGSTYSRSYVANNQERLAPADKEPNG